MCLSRKAVLGRGGGGGKRFHPLGDSSEHGGLLLPMMTALGSFTGPAPSRRRACFCFVHIATLLRIEGRMPPRLAPPPCCTGAIWVGGGVRSAAGNKVGMESLATPCVWSRLLRNRSTCGHRAIPARILVSFVSRVEDLKSPVGRGGLVCADAGSRRVASASDPPSPLCRTCDSGTPSLART